MKEHPVILFDGVCNFCNGAVNFLIKHDKKKVFRFAALQSDVGKRLLEKHNLPKENFESFILIEDGKIYQSSTAGLKVAKRLSPYWQWTQVLWIVPKPLRNAVYNFIAKNRYKWFGKKEVCMIPTRELRNRFLD